jgi:hypothetical protein
LYENKRRNTRIKKKSMRSDLFLVLGHRRPASAVNTKGSRWSTYGRGTDVYDPLFFLFLFLVRKKTAGHEPVLISLLPLHEKKGRKKRSTNWFQEKEHDNLLQPTALLTGRP